MTLHQTPILSRDGDGSGNDIPEDLTALSDDALRAAGQTVSDDLERAAADADTSDDTFAGLTDRAEGIAAELTRRANVRDAADRRQATTDNLRSLLADTPDRVQLDRRRAPIPGVHRGNDPWDMAEVSRSLHDADALAERALDAVEAIPVDDSIRQSLTQVVETGQGEVPQMVLVTTSPAYRAAFGEYLRRGGDLSRLSDDQVRALEFAEPLRRAMSAATNGAGGYLVPTDIETAVTLVDDGTTNPIYGLARKVQTTAQTFRNVGATNAAWSWDGENTEVSDDTSTFTNTDIPLHFAQGFVPMSIAAEQSIVGAIGVARQTLMTGWDDLVGAALTTGSGSSQPTGIITALDGTASELSPATAETFAVADVYSVQEGLAARHRRRSTWLAEVSTISAIRQFATDDGASLIARLGDADPQRLLGRPLVENEDMAGASGINAAANADNFILVLGDFQHYVIAEGIGSLAEVIPHVMGPNGRPIGARGLYMATRFGADCVLDAAFRTMNVATTV